MSLAVVIFILIALGMQVASSWKNHTVSQETKGVIKSRSDLDRVKEAINLSMRLAVIYIILFVAFIVLLGVFVARGTPLLRASLGLFIFGVVTLPVGLIGKFFEKKIKKLEVRSDDPRLAEDYAAYLKQWDEPRFQLSERKND